jgi:hypothetical protein
MKLKLHRDHVVSIVRGKDLVGVYVVLPPDWDVIGLVSRELLLAEMHPKKADAILKLWNGK